MNVRKSLAGLSVLASALLIALGVFMHFTRLDALVPAVPDAATADAAGRGHVFVGDAPLILAPATLKKQ